MVHYSRLSKIVIDVPPAEHDRELAFWSAAVGQQLAQGDRHPEYHGAALHGREFGLLVQRLGHGSGRVHLDIHTDDLAAELARLERLGAASTGGALLVDPARSRRAAVLRRPGARRLAQRQQRATLGLMPPGSSEDEGDQHLG
ncbi:MAG: VOC family protein [Streptosporangiaceae bacterium]|jgi:glyoxalase superfamily protein